MRKKIFVQDLEEDDYLRGFVEVEVVVEDLYRGFFEHGGLFFL